VAPDRPAHILLVEDNQLVIDALTVLFDAAGRRVSGARSLAEARAMAKTDPPALVLLDLRLPDGDGLSLVPELRAAGAVVVALTGDDDPAKRKLCVDAGCADVLIKPVPARQLMALADEWMH
jgi:DNA-binding response OmpR family regulator